MFHVEHIYFDLFNVPRETLNNEISATIAQTPSNITNG